MNPYLAAECLYILQAKRQMSASTSLVIDFSGRLHGCVTYLNFALLLLSHAADTSRNELLEDAEKAESSPCEAHARRPLRKSENVLVIDTYLNCVLWNHGWIHTTVGFDGSHRKREIHTVYFVFAYVIWQEIY